MKYKLLIFLLIVFLAACTTKRPAFMQQAEVQLSTPYVQVKDVFFHQETTVSIGEYPSGISLYVVNQETAEKSEKLVSNNEIKISKSAILRFQAKGLHFLPSKITELQLYKVEDRMVEISYITPRAKPYNGANPSVLLDHEKAETKFSDAGWLGFKQDSVEIDLVLDGSPLEGVVLSCLEDQKSWIFGASFMRVEAFDQNDKLLHASEISCNDLAQKEGASFQYLKAGFESILPNRLKLTVYTLSEIPQGHPGSGTLPWLFIDEIVLL